MPHHFEFDPENRILLLVGEGDVHPQELQQINDQIRVRVEQLHPAAGIMDYTAVNTFELPSEMVRMAARQPSPYPEDTPRFIVAPSDYLFGLSRMYQLVANRPKEKLQVVRTRDEALAAIGARNAQFEKVD